MQDFKNFISEASNINEDANLTSVIKLIKKKIEEVGEGDCRFEINELHGAITKVQT